MTAAPPPAAARPRPARLDVGVVGTGRVGAVLGAALAAAGHRVVAASAVSAASRTRADALLPGVPLVDPRDVVEAASLVLLAVPDDELGPLATGLAEVGAFRSGQLVVHPSGRWGTGVLAPATSAGVLPLALHPVMTFTGTSLDLSRLQGCSFAVTAPDVLRPIGHALVVEMGGEPQDVAEEARPLYHAALASAANSLVTLVAQAQDLLRRCGVEDPARMVAPLLSAALDGALREGDAALTGPVARGDAGTVEAHVRELAAVSPEAAAAYVALARLTADRALAAGVLAPERAEPLLGVLSGWRA
ncbi:putative short-subunit dehydrogenase-like oxidoreductase (DUF2520 family) [Motilibacter rhizosphaerae]|uniref:Putative short-subunit dehydrogenase-like oxidoreductase (DUF2520 family) n=1 Tax=Motilibacter rhizosphaerae TaxID=598652 RepID=A0A4Q7NAF4_9ACTN|nr:DUF2520 domain-containing protein [Motilibacter rhizosphaerae]RZS79451.1 putative short-subunit dehydrogenase-like oxidoreductase (DUF2520 family) [Motilibacter rhizosphaerae]